MRLSFKSFFLAISLLSVNTTQAQFTVPTHHELKLEKVLIFSRHGLRAPIDDAEKMAQWSPYAWAKFDEPAGHLTAKGTILETYFGQYIGQWLRDKGLLNNENCATGTGIYAYANNIQRTVATGQAIVAGGFSGCSVALQHQPQNGIRDPLFDFFLRTDDAAFKQRAVERLNVATANQELASSYQLLNHVLDYQHSERCLKQGKCDLGENNGQLVLVKGKTPKISGAMAKGKNLVNALLLAHYVGKPAQEIAQGQVNTWEKWVQLNRIKNQQAKLLYQNNPELAANVALPLLQWIQQDMQSDRRISLLVGHNTNIMALLGALQVPVNDLPEQLENIPIGGKLFFEVWKNPRTGEQKFKLEYVYQTDTQIVQAKPLSLKQPAKHVTLKMAQCPSDQWGFCGYDAFQAALAQSIQNGTVAPE